MHGSPLRIGLIGYGRMGQLIDQLAQEHHAEIVWRIRTENRHELTPTLLQSAQVVIEMTHPEAALAHVLACLDAGVPVVTGTTGWQPDLPKAYAHCAARNGSMLYASNFSIGVNLFFAFNRYVAQKLGKSDLYEAEISEWHHIHKKDAPSGTAVTIAEGILEAHHGYDAWQLTSDDVTSPPHVLPVRAYRAGEIIGIHMVRWSGTHDEISLTHKAHDRTGFAVGALTAARYIHNKIGVFTMQDVIGGI